MADQSFEYDVLRDLLTGAADIGQLAANEKTFLSAYNAFRAGDRKTFQADLAQLRLVPECRRICEWMRSKECVFLCVELCGPPTAEAAPPDVHALAEAIVRVTANPRLVQELAQIVEKRDKAAFERFVTAEKLQPFCQFFCHWVCVVRWRLVCRWICDLQLEQQPDLAGELTTAGRALGALLENRPAFDTVLAASQAGDSAKMRAELNSVGLIPFCRLICEWFCSWHCVLACFTLCRQFPLPVIENEPTEAFTFARATQALGNELERLSAAVGAGDVKTFSAIVTELKLQRYCVQLCHWLCFIRCRRFCFLVCPPPDTTPLFTNVGIYEIPTISVAGDFNPDGTTKAGNLAFTETIPLSGIMPDGQAAQAYEYRFLVNENTPTAGSPLPAEGAQVAPTVIGQLEFWEYDNGSSTWFINHKAIGVNESFAPYAIPQPGNTTLPPVDLNVAVGADGWIPVPRMNDYTQGGIGRFVPGGGLDGTDALINLDTTQFTNENINLGALQAGDSLPTMPPPGDLSPRPTYTIAFEARVVSTTTLVASNSLANIAFSNTHYIYNRHPEWDGGPIPAPGTIDVCSLDIEELRTGSGCAKLTTTCTALYTCYHPYLGSVEMWLQGPGIAGSPPPPGPYYFAPALPAYGPGAVEVASGLVGHVFDITGLASCAYILHLRTSPNLTTGDGNIGYVDEDLMAFCTQSPMGT